MNSAKSQLFQPYLEGGKPHTKQSQAVKQPVLLFPQTHHPRAECAARLATAVEVWLELTPLLQRLLGEYNRPNSGTHHGKLWVYF